MRSKKITLSDKRTIEVRELPLGKLNLFLKAIRELPSGITDDPTGAIGMRLLAALPGILASGWTDFMDAILASTDLTQEDLDTNVNINDGAAIIGAMIEVNEIERVSKTIGQWFKAAKAKKTG